MHEDVSNSGIFQRGGSISVGNLAVGRGARIQLGDMTCLEQRGMEEVALRLRQLSDVLTEQRSSIGSYAEVSEATSRLAVELQRTEPRQSRVLRWLAVIARGAGSVASVASAVESLRTAVLAVL